MFNFDQMPALKSLSWEQLEALSGDLRERIIDSVSKNGGHLASNLGVVELTLALHRTFEPPNDKIIFDVSHQCYVHKLLSGRNHGFDGLRGEDGVSGFQLRSESDYDFFGGGHSGTALSAALGFAEANKMNGSGNYAVAVIGDGSFTNGMVYEALNNADKKGLKLIVILNDNEMSISENVGAMSHYFGRLRSSVKYYRFKRKVKNRLGKIKIIGAPIFFIGRAVKNLFKKLFVKTTLFENLGLCYMGPVDGHDQKKLEAVLNEAKYIDSPVIVHVCTVKGKGYRFAEERPAIYHSVSKFDREKGIVVERSHESDYEYSGFSQCFGKTLTELADEDSNITAISAAMCEGTGLDEFVEKHPDRFFDVGIAEEHAVTFAAGLAAAGKKPVVALYSTFLQRAYDQIIHDVAIQKLGVVFAIDRAGFVPGDGVTHQGIFDLAFLLQIPGLVLYTPETYSDMKAMLSEVVKSDVPCAIRYQKGYEPEYDRSGFEDFGDYSAYTCGSGKRVTVISYGRTVMNAYNAAMSLQDCCLTTVVSLKRIKPFDATALWEQCKDSEQIVFVEEQVKNGGVSEHIISSLVSLGVKLPRTDIIAVDEEFPGHASISALHKRFGMDTESIISLIK